MDSDSFRELLGNEENKRGLLEASGWLGSPYELWEEARRLIADAINHGGTIVDLGCANGFLLKCLQEWSIYPLDPYGLDIDPKMVLAAHQLFPGLNDHFVRFDLYHIAGINPDLPAEFDFVYFGCFDSFRFRTPLEIAVLAKLFSLVREKGRLIIGFYDSDKDAESKIALLAGLGYPAGGTVKNGFTRVIWIEKEN